MADESKGTILVVDDNPFNTELVTAVVEKEGYFPVDVASGKEALVKIDEMRFDLILLDLLMPGLDGFETARRIRQAGVDTPIVAVSAISFKQDRQRALESGCNDFLPKPIDTGEL